MQKQIIGLDIGGANLKLATATGDARSMVFPLWKHPEKLGEGLKTLVGDLPVSEIGITMTGELCDCFRTKRDGVTHIVQAVEQLWQGQARYWSTEGKFVSTSEAIENPLKVAASNWHGLATYLARLFPEGNWLLVDIGSTTTDLIRIEEGIVNARGKTDPERFQEGELLYTGVKRTPIFGILPHTAGEWFATTQDAYVLLGDIPEEPDNKETADNRPLTKEYAAERLLRCYLHDTETASVQRAFEIAEEISKTQLNMVSRQIELALGGKWPLFKGILSGGGGFLAKRAWKSLWFKESRSLSAEWGEKLAEVAPAYAMAKLMEQNAGAEDPV